MNEINDSHLIIGNQEWCALPELGVHAIKVRVDSGAATSAIHAYDLEPFKKGDEKWLRYELHPLNEDDALVIRCESKVFSKRKIKSSNGEAERRYVIETPMKILGQEQERIIQITLSNRDEMGFRMLLGRQAMAENILIAPAKELILGDFDIEKLNNLYNVNQTKTPIKNFFIAIYQRVFK